jgi:hypothetical protein
MLSLSLPMSSDVRRCGVVVLSWDWEGEAASWDGDAEMDTWKVRTLGVSEGRRGDDADVQRKVRLGRGKRQPRSWLVVGCGVCVQAPGSAQLLAGLLS